MFEQKIFIGFMMTTKIKRLSINKVSVKKLRKILACLEGFK